MCERDRIDMLKALRWVDEVRVFDEDTPERLIQKVQPDVLVKGADWVGKPVAGADFVRARGGAVTFAPLRSGYSTSLLAHRLAEMS
jgi:bifunctional ADP-heptose synthase (sugar kinase/adenylyltransferase)